MHQALERLKESCREKLVKDGMPDFVSPMKATLVHEPFSDPEWIYERKLDGERCLLIKNGNKVRLMSRNRLCKNREYPEIAHAVRGVKARFIADAEIVTFVGRRTSFSRLQQRMHNHKPGEELLEEVPVHAYVFDLLHFDGYDLRMLPLRERKRVLRGGLDLEEPLWHLPYRNECGTAYFREACHKRWEGLIAKKVSSLYVSSRSRLWLKFKCGHRQELVIGGYTEPKGSRTGFGALLLGYYADGEFCYAGKVGTGFNEKTLRNLHDKLQDLERKTPPFEDVDEKSDDCHWVRPELVGEIGFTEWTDSGKLRHPRFLGLRDDKPARKVGREG